MLADSRKRHFVNFKIAVYLVGKGFDFRVAAALGRRIEHPLNMDSQALRNILNARGVLVLELRQPEMKYVLYSDDQKTKKQSDNADQFNFHTVSSFLYL